MLQESYHARVYGGVSASPLKTSEFGPESTRFLRRAAGRNVTNLTWWGKLVDGFRCGGLDHADLQVTMRF